MWPLNTRTGGARARRRTPMRVACLIYLALAAHADGVAAATDTSSVREQDVRTAEKVVAKLRLLDDAAARDDADALRALAAKHYPGLFVTVADMRESDLKTDLDTAVFTYERIIRAWRAAGATEADCSSERTDIYLPLCLDLRGGTVRQLLISKARLHARWAEALIKTHRGAADAESSRALAAMRAAREADAALAARVVGRLQDLEELVSTSLTDAEGEEHRTLSGIGFDRLAAEFTAAHGAAAALLASMPRGPAFYHLSNALGCYRDGLFWSRKLHQSKKLTVSANGFAHDPLADLRLEPGQVSNSVAVNWKKARKYTRLAEQSVASQQMLSKL